MDEIAEKLLKPAPTEEELAAAETPKPATESPSGATTGAADNAKTPAPDQQKQNQAATPKTPKQP